MDPEGVRSVVKFFAVLADTYLVFPLSHFPSSSYTSGIDAVARCALCDKATPAVVDKPVTRSPWVLLVGTVPVATTLLQGRSYAGTPQVLSSLATGLLVPRVPRGRVLLAVTRCGAGFESGAFSVSARTVSQGDVGNDIALGLGQFTAIAGYSSDVPV